MREWFYELFVCPECRSSLVWSPDAVTCPDCKASFPIQDGIPRFVTAMDHENFHIQWKKFYDVQLDSMNGTSCSRDRLLDQSELMPDYFRLKRVLEVGCGAGRFTEILLKLGADVIAVDYSSAVEACAKSNAASRMSGHLFNAQADVFHLPFSEASFDIVIGYGMLQHTGDAPAALKCLWQRVRPGGLLLVDRYQLSLRSANPIKYMLRPVLKRMPHLFVLELAEKTCRVMVPLQKRLLRFFRGDGLGRYIRYVINRSVNSTYPLNLEIAGKLDQDIAFRWSVLDTFDMWAPKYDAPQTFSAWKKDLTRLAGGKIVVCKSGGQGNIGVVRRDV